MNLAKPINIRFDKKTKAKLKKLAAMSGLTPTDLIRSATRIMVAKWTKAGKVSFGAD